LLSYGKINISIITYYEILSGLKHKNAQKRMESFVDFCQKAAILPLTIDAVNISAEIYAQTRKDGHPIDDIDLLIAGIAISNHLVLSTHNEKHFKHIEGLEITDWSKGDQK